MPVAHLPPDALEDIEDVRASFRVLEEPAPDDGAWLRARHGAVDALERPFAARDRVRFGGPVSRDRLITAPRERYPLSLSA